MGRLFEKPECPNMWENCDDCIHATDVTCPKIIEERAELQKVAKEVEQDVAQKAREDAVRISTANISALIHADSDTFWHWWSRTSPPDSLVQRIPLPLGGPIVPGGGSRVKRKKKPEKKIAEYLKTWGT